MEVVLGEGSCDNSPFSIFNSTFGKFIEGELVFMPAYTTNTARKAAAARRWNADILLTAERIAANTPKVSSRTHSQARAASASNGANSHCNAILVASMGSPVMLSSTKDG